METCPVCWFVPLRMPSTATSVWGIYAYRCVGCGTTVPHSASPRKGPWPARKDYMPLSILVEGTPGDSLETLLTEAKALAQSLHCGVHFNYHGHRAWILPDDAVQTQLAYLEHLWHHHKEQHSGEPL